MLDMLIIHAAQVVTCAADAPKRGDAMRDVGIIPDGAVAIHDGRIVEVGTTADLLVKHSARQTLDASAKVVCPGLVDSHTHIVYAGDRVAEFEQRIGGVSYQDIMAAGGGIVSTMRHTRAASLEQLVKETRPRLDAMLELGTTCAEIKTGYGLDTASELRMLEAIAELDKTHPIQIIPTFLGAHAIPPEYRGDEDAYADLVINEMIPQAAQWYQNSHFAAQGTPFFIDVFCERNAFTLEQSRRVIETGAAHGMRVKAHVDEFTSLGGVEMAAGHGAVSVDHLDVTPHEDIAHLRDGDTVAIVIPAVNFNLGSSYFADARALLDGGAALALATDFNPGSAPCPSLPLVMAIACRYQRLLPSEALNAATINAAYAVGMGEKLGSLQAGKQADCLILDSHDYRHLAYQFGGNLVKTVIKSGEIMQRR